MQSWICTSCLERREEVIYHEELLDCTDVQHEIGDQRRKEVRDNVLISVTDCLTEKTVDDAGVSCIQTPLTVEDFSHLSVCRVT